MFKERDFFKEPFPEPELRSLAKGTAISDLFSWNSPSFKALGLPTESLTDDDLVRLMLKEPRIIRRPLIAIGQRLIVGFNPTTLKNALDNLAQKQ